LQKEKANIVLVLILIVALSINVLVSVSGSHVLPEPANMSFAVAATDSAELKLKVAVDTDTPIPNENTPTFVDISPGDWFYDEVIALISAGHISGYGDGSFRPVQTVTRAEVAAFLARSKALMREGERPFFNDVREADWFYEDVVAVYNSGLMNGMAPGIFAPAKSLTREQASAIMVRASGAINVVNEQEQELWLQGFKDRRKISGWAKPYIATAVKFGLINGYPNQEFRPTAQVSRAEVCTLMWNLLYGGVKLRNGYPGFVDPYPLKPEVTSPLASQVIYGKNYKLTAKIDPETPIHELWVDGELVEVKRTNGASVIVFSNTKVTGQTHYVGVVSKNSSGSAYSGTLTLYHFPVPSNYDRLIIVDKSEFRLYWIVKGFVKNTYPVAIGKDRTPTPDAEWIVGQKLIEDPKGVFGPRRLRLYRLINGDYHYTGYGIHGTNQPGSIGKKASKGCIRLKNEEILELWPQAEIGDRVFTQQ